MSVARLLLRRSMEWRLVRLAREDGMCPDMELSLIASSISDLRLPSSAGIVPLMPFEYISSDMSAVRDPISGGMVPFKF